MLTSHLSVDVLSGNVCFILKRRVEYMASNMAVNSLAWKANVHSASAGH